MKNYFAASMHLKMEAAILKYVLKNFTPSILYFFCFSIDKKFNIEYPV